MKVSQANPPAGRFDQVFQMASEATGTSFEYLLATAKRESSLRPELQARTSSATGLFQFIEQTWLSMIKEEGAELGLSSFADAITVDAKGKASVADPATRQQILDLRKDPTLSAIMAGRLTQKNAAQLESALGRQPTGGELYIAHFMGPTGARKLIELATQNPLASAAAAFPRAAEANRSIFYDKDGRARGAAEVYTELVARHPDEARQIASAADAKASTTPNSEVAASRVAVAFSALPDEVRDAISQPMAPGFDAFRAKKPDTSFTANTSTTTDPFKSVLNETTSAEANAPQDTAIETSALGYANQARPLARPLLPPNPNAASAPAPSSPQVEARRSRLVTDPASWGGAQQPRQTTSATEPTRATPTAPSQTASERAAKPAETTTTTTTATSTTTATAPTQRPRVTNTAGIVATASGPANANRGGSRADTAARPLDLTNFLSYRVHREPKDLLPPL